jgi:four helix bundle protein
VSSDTILTLIADVAPLAEQIGRHDPALAKQFRDALDSVALKCAEASAQRGARLTNHYAIALGSARESLVALRAAEAWRYIGPVPQAIRNAFDTVIGRMTGLTFVSTAASATPASLALACAVFNAVIAAVRLSNS